MSDLRTANTGHKRSTRHQRVSNTDRQHRKHGAEAIPRRFLYAPAMNRSVFVRLLLRYLRFHVLVHEAHHALKHVAGLCEVGRMAGMPVTLEVFKRDLAARLAVSRLQLVAREIRLRVLVVVASVRRGPGTRPQAASQTFRRARAPAPGCLRSFGLALPIGVLLGSRTSAIRADSACHRTLGMAITAEELITGRHHDAAHASASSRRACRQWERGVAGRVDAWRRASPDSLDWPRADQIGSGFERARIELRPAA